MKLQFLFIILLTSTMSLFAQRRAGGVWMNIAVKGGVGLTNVINKNISKDPNVKKTFFSPNYNYGLRAGFHINEITSISFEGVKTLYTQKYSISGAGIHQDMKYSKTLDFTSKDFALLFRMTTFQGIYAEAGPKLSWLEAFSVTNDIEEKFNDVTIDDFKERSTSILVGAGAIIFRTRDDRLQFTAGLRMSVTLDGILADINRPPVKDGFYEMNLDYFDSYQDIVATRLMLVQTVFEINYFFGYYGRTRRGNRVRLVLFQRV